MNKPVPIVKVERRIDRLLGIVLMVMGFLGLLIGVYRLGVGKQVERTIFIVLWSLIVLLMGVFSLRRGGA